jgi:peptidyl-prolyl cis-trans isomerase D
MRTPSLNQGPASQYAGIAFGKKVSNEDYAKSYKACYNQALMLYGTDLPKVIERLNLKSQAWERIVLIREAKQQHITINDNEVRDRIISIFGGSDNFNKEQYETILANYFNTTPRAFEEEIRDSLKISNLLETITADISISDEEILEMYKKENEKTKVAYVAIEPASFIDGITPSDSTLETYYNENKNMFQTQTQINVEYIVLATNNNLDKAEVTQEEIENYYNLNKETFVIVAEGEKSPEETQYRSLSDVEKEIKTTLLTQQAKDYALDKAVVIEQEISDGATLDEAAIKNGIEIKETGLFAANQSIPEIGWNFQFLQAAFNLEEGEISEITEMPDGYYILRLKEKKIPYVPEFIEAKDKVKQAYIAAEAIELAKNQATKYQKDFKDRMSNGENFRDIAKSLNLGVLETDFFSYNDYVQGIGKSIEFNDAAFNLKKDEVSMVIPTSKNFIILTPEDKSSINLKQFEIDKEEFSKKALQIKQGEVFQEWFGNLLQEADIKSNV